MKTPSNRPFSLGMRQVLSLAAAATAFCLTTHALADETPSTPVEAPAAASNSPPAPVEAPTLEQADAASPVEPPVAPAPVTSGSTLEQVASPVESAVAPAQAPAPAPAPATSAFAAMAGFEVPSLGLAPQKDRASAAPSSDAPKSETLRIGGMMGVGFPRPFAVEAFAKYKRVVGVGAEYSFMPDATIMGTDVKFRGVAADLRLFPFKGGFFVGVRGGKQWLEAKTTLTINRGALGTYTEGAAASTWFVNPRVGYLKTWDNGITVGIDAGVQIPIGPSYERQISGSSYGVDTGADKALATVANVLGNKTTPTIDLLRVGFMF
ncbi:MAG: hypothetical protein KIT84_07080 [Labilithrix sp.]|nr:hypothetical protein [Labilithrix sp.]MCW5810758.1 hypothetical protein [Labilithrix sp.]